MAAHYELELEGGQEAIVKLRLTNSTIFSEKLSPFGEFFDIIFKDRIREADEFYSGLLHKNLSREEVAISRQAYAGEYTASHSACCHTLHGNTCTKWNGYSTSDNILISTCTKT